MFALLPTLVPVLLVDVLNPVLFAILVFAVGSNRPIINSSAILLGHTLAYFIAGVAVSHGVEQIAARLTNPHPIDFVFSGVVGLGLLWMVVRTKKDGAPVANEPEWELTPAKCFGFGAVLNFVGIPFALPYFAVIDQIVKANLSMAESFTTLVIYNVAYALPFAAVPVMVAVSGDSAKPFLERVNGFIAKAADIVMPWMLGLLGLALLADSAAFFYRGEGLWQF